jgi:hypothetical protein
LGTSFCCELHNWIAVTVKYFDNSARAGRNANSAGGMAFRLAQVPLERVAPALEQLAPLAAKVLPDLSILYPERTNVPGISSLKTQHFKKIEDGPGDGKAPGSV